MEGLLDYYVFGYGFFILDQVGADIDGLLVEDIFTAYSFTDKSYNLASADHMKERMTPAQHFHEKFGKPVFALDYLKSTFFQKQ